MLCGSCIQPKKQFKVQIIGILEEIDSFYWPKMHWLKGAKKFGQAPPSHSHLIWTKSKRTAFFRDAFPCTAHTLAYMATYVIIYYPKFISSKGGNIQSKKQFRVKNIARIANAVQVTLWLSLHHLNRCLCSCSSQPSIVQWLSSPIFPFCLSFVRPSRYGDIRPILHFFQYVQA